MSRTRLTGPPNPFQTYLLAAATLAGLLALFGFAKPSSIEQTLSPLLRLAWALLLFAGGGVALVGQYWIGRPFTAVRIKRAGLIAAGGGSLAYGVALLLLFGRQGAAAGIYNLAFASAAFLRAWQITQILRVAQTYAARHDEATDAAAAAGGSR